MVGGAPALAGGPFAPGAGFGFPARSSEWRQASKAARSRQRDQVECVTPSGSAPSRRSRKKPRKPSFWVRVESRAAKRDSNAGSCPGCGHRGRERVSGRRCRLVFAFVL